MRTTTLEKKKVDRLKELQESFQKVFPRESEAVDTVLEYLKWKAKIGERIGVKDGERRLDRVEGRREMIYIIEMFRELDFEVLYMVLEDGRSMEEAWLIKRERDKQRAIQK